MFISSKGSLSLLRQESLKHGQRNEATAEQGSKYPLEAGIHQNLECAIEKSYCSLPDVQDKPYQITDDTERDPPNTDPSAHTTQCCYTWANSGLWPTHTGRCLQEWKKKHHLDTCLQTPKPHFDTMKEAILHGIVCFSKTDHLIRIIKVC